MCGTGSLYHMLYLVQHMKVWRFMSFLYKASVKPDGGDNRLTVYGHVTKGGSQEVVKVRMVFAQGMEQS